MSFFEELRALENSGIDLIEILGQDDVIHSPAELAEIIERLRRPGEDLYSELLYSLTYRRFSPEEASRLWKSIMKHKRRMSAALGRNVAFRVAALDYLSTRNQKLRGVRLIAKPEFDDILSYVNIDETASVYNRRYFNEVLGYEVHRARRYGGPLSLLLLDIDNFKRVNDRLGHLEGDAVLRALGRLLCQQTRNSDTVCRFGGDEFAVVLPQTEEEHAYQLAERVRGSVKDTLGVRKPYPVTVSIGGASYPDGCDEADELVQLADQMCLDAKRNGKDQVRMSGRDDV